MMKIAYLELAGTIRLQRSAVLRIKYIGFINSRSDVLVMYETIFIKDSIRFP